MDGVISDKAVTSSPQKILLQSLPMGEPNRRNSDLIATVQRHGLDRMIPKPGLMKILQSVSLDCGGKFRMGRREWFTFLEISSCLKEYIKERNLFDPSSPALIHCQSDPIGDVFGVQQFMIYDVHDLVRNNSQILNNYTEFATSTTPSKPRPAVENLTMSVKEGQLGRCQPFSASLNLTNRFCCNDGGVSDACREVTSTTGSLTPVVVSSPVGVKRSRVENEGEVTESPKRIRMVNDSKPEMERPRRTSLSLVYTDRRLSTCCVVYEDCNSSEVESVYSVQSKVTATVKDSSDDLWIIGQEEEINDSFDNSTDDDTVAMNVYVEEFDVVSNVSEISDSGTDYFDLLNPEKDFFLCCDDSDVEYFADCESDLIVSKMDEDKLSLWKCRSCEYFNNSIDHFCDRCWSSRSQETANPMFNSPDQTGNLFNSSQDSGIFENESVLPATTSIHADDDYPNRLDMVSMLNEDTGNISGENTGPASKENNNFLTKEYAVVASQESTIPSLDDTFECQSNINSCISKENCDFSVEEIIITKKKKVPTATLR